MLKTYVKSLDVFKILRTLLFAFLGTVLVYFLYFILKPTHTELSTSLRDRSTPDVMATSFQGSGPPSVKKNKILVSKDNPHQCLDSWVHQIPKSSLKMMEIPLGQSFSVSLKDVEHFCFSDLSQVRFFKKKKKKSLKVFVENLKSSFFAIEVRHSSVKQKSFFAVDVYQITPYLKKNITDQAKENKTLQKHKKIKKKEPLVLQGWG